MGATPESVLTRTKAADLESQGWRTWLMTVFPFWFSESFSKEHEAYWELHWNTLHKIRNKDKIDDAEMVRLLLLGRGLGKSATAEAARIMRGCLRGKGYSLVISETDDQAQEHLGNARLLIEHPDSRLTEFYPDMAIAENADALKGMPTADRKEMFICKNGYIFRAKGLTAKMRGLRVGIHRPDDILLDDIDDVLDSLAVSKSKLKLITASILPVQAREYVTVDFAQNMISEHSVVNQIYTGRAEGLAERTVIGPAPAFTTLDVETYFDDDGRPRHRILESSVPSWDGLNIDRAQKFLNDSGLEVFMAEYQNEFSQFSSGKVIPEYHEPSQIISWSEFEQVFGERGIPAHWRRMAGLDVGYSEGAHPHYSAWNFVATAAENSPLPGTVFLYKSRSFKGVSIDDQADIIKSELGPDEVARVNLWQMSHERTGEMLTLRNKHGLSFGKFTYYKAEDGVAPWRHLSKRDQTRSNPFKFDEEFDGTWRLGRPNLYYIVDDDQVVRPVDDNGMRLLREQVSTWEYVPIKVTDNGQTAQKPSKVNDDHPDCVKGILALFGPGSTALSAMEIKEREMKKVFAHSEEASGAPPENILMGKMLWSKKYDEQRKEKKRDPMGFRN